MGFDPVEIDVNRYLAKEAAEASFCQFVESEMEKYKDEAIKRCYILTKPDFAEYVAATIAFGYRDGLKEAEKIVDELHLEEKHIAALNDDEGRMRELIEQDKISSWEEYLYDSINY